METERDRLARLYAELGDEHLQDLADEPEDLTDEARLAVAAEMRKRGFDPEPQRDAMPEEELVSERESGFGAGIPGIFPSGASTVEQALEPGGEERAGWVSLVSFYDGLELSRACEALEDSDVDFAIEELLGDALSGGGTRFELWIQPADMDLAQRVLREKLGLFPPPEIETTGTGLDGTAAMTLGHFDSEAEAKAAVQTLAASGIVGTIAPPDDEDEEAWWTVEVPAEDLDRGLKLVASGLGMPATQP